MADYGSLFLLHLKLEGRPLWPGRAGSSLGTLLDRLPPYRYARRDVEGFVTALEDVRRSLADGGDPSFELAVLATVIRHCSILTCYLLGAPQFDRRSSITEAFVAVGMGHAAAGALDLYQFRLARSRGIPVNEPPTAFTTREWCAVASEFVKRTGDLRGC